jgi:GNAT superfamily N-acetyltransferase
LPEHDDAVVVEAPDTPAFVDAAGDLRDSTPAQREAHRERLMNSPLGKRYAVVRAGGRVVCTAQVAVEGELAGLFDVNTAPDARRQGYATLACASLLSWAWQHGAQGAYLQVSADNGPAIGSYRRFGFATAYTYHYRGRAGERE